MCTQFAMLLAFCPCSVALDPSLDISQYAHTSWKLSEGFARGEIVAIAQTPDGYLWLGTTFGVLRFDGTKPVSWQPPGEQLPDNYILSLLGARDGSLWIGTSKGLVSWKKGKLRHYPELHGQMIAALLEDGEGTIWVGVWVGVTANPAPGKLCKIEDGIAICYGNDGGLGVGVTSLYEDTKGNLWAGVVNGLWRWQPGISEFHSIPDEPDGVRSFAEDEDGTLLIGMHGRGLCRFASGMPEPFIVTNSAQRSGVNSIFRDHAGGLWIGTMHRGITHIYRGRVNTFTPNEGLSGEEVYSTFEDREGNIWLGTNGGLDRFRESTVTTFTVKQGLSSNNVGSVVANGGVVWLSTFDGLEKFADGVVTTFGSNGKLDGDRPGSLFKDSEGRVWASTLHGFGFLKNNRFFPSEIPGGGVHSITEDSPGSLWIANQELGLFHMVRTAVTQHIPLAGLGQKDYVNAIVADPLHGGLWLGFSRGEVAHFVDGTIRASYEMGEGFVNSLGVDRNGSLWIASTGGLHRLSDGSINTLASKNGLPCDAVHWAIEDDDGSLWLGMPCGLARIARSELNAWIKDPKRAIQAAVFDSSDGVRSRAVDSGYHPSVTKSSDGKLWFLSQLGVSFIDPHHLSFNKLPPPVHIEQLTADDKSYDASNGLRLPAHVSNLLIDYTALSLTVPEKVHFRYKLEGQDKDWREVINERRVRYTNLSPKHYRFRVLASNNSGVWNEEGASLEFVIPPMWYQTNWFRSLCAAVLLALIWMLHQVRLRQQARQFNRTLEARVGERTRIARELHDTLLQSFHGLLLQFRAASQLVQPHSQAKQILDTAIDGAAEAIAESRKTVQGLRTSTLQGRDLGKAIRTVGEELAAANSGEAIAFQVQGVGPRRDLRALVHDEVYRIAVEALRNAFQHAGAKRITVEIHYEPREFRLSVSDDGRGIDTQVLQGEGVKGHFGLPGMRERATIIGGKLDVWSSVGEGTEINLTIPGTKAYSGVDERPWWSGKLLRKEKDDSKAAKTSH